MPLFSKNLNNLSHLFWLFAKTKTLSHFSSSNSFSSRVLFFPLSTGYNHSSIVWAVVTSGSILISVGFLRTFFVSFAISFGNVAEQSSVCRSLGSKLIILFISSSKPRSRSLSASSNITVSKALKFRAFLSNRSKSLPGVAIKISAPPFKLIICGLIFTPPSTVRDLIFRYLLYCLTLFPTCIANSLVGTSISDRILFFLFTIFLVIFLSKGRVNPAVLPLPVWAIAKMSLFFKNIGIDSFCILVGSIYPTSSTALQISLLNPRDLKLSKLLFIGYPNCLSLLNDLLQVGVVYTLLHIFHKLYNLQLYPVYQLKSPTHKQNLTF